jgi:vacuolar iron transporter family protein
MVPERTESCGHQRSPTGTPSGLRPGHAQFDPCAKRPSKLRVTCASSLAKAVTLALTAVALPAGGMAVGRLTGRPVVRSGLRQLTLGGLAIAVTFGVGHLIGAHGA